MYNDFLVFPKMEDLKETFVKSRVQVFTGAVNVDNQAPVRVLFPPRISKAIRSVRSTGRPMLARASMVNERERDAVSDVIILVDSRSGPRLDPSAATRWCVPPAPRLRLPSTSSVVVTPLSSSR